MNVVMLNKALHGIGNGFDRRTSNVRPISIIIHTTNGNYGSSYEKEREFIYNAKGIGAHFLVGKQGQITQFLDTNLRAWHAGTVNDQRFNNNNSIGIECHFTIGEYWTKLMHDALTELVLYLISANKIAGPSLIETHRKVAYPAGRKIDPSGFPDDEFYVWRNGLFIKQAPIVHEIKYKVISQEVNIRQSPKVAPNNISGALYKGDIFYSQALKIDEDGKSIHGINTWAHVTKGISKGKPVDGLGFVHTSNLIIVG